MALNNTQAWLLSTAPVSATAYKPPTFSTLLHRPHFNYRSRNHDILKKEAIEKVPPHTPGFWSRLFLLPKKDDGLRPVLDLRPLNQYLPTIHFKRESWPTITNMIQPGDYLISIDLRDAFHHIIAIHPIHRHLLQFQWRNKLYQYSHRSI
ncbi:hypothetical protein INT45_010940 [Circinella minor]|uniref:Reverse transcriptase domain-containing protein n=1 Tax=Circinella minor TaxID=1195481 RepID=A0A8H7VDF7_9FUNG|nr:hypothetical protein INT45_010940 [Circinella minor]